MLNKHMPGNGNNSRRKDNHELLQKATSRALFLHNPTPKFLFPSSKDRSKSADICFSESKSDSNSRISKEDVSSKDKKPSSRLGWKKPLRALSHIGQQKFNCSFFLHVRSIDGLPLSFNGINLCVYWKRKDKVLKTGSTRVIQGKAEFNETLMHRCSVYVTRNEQNWVKYGEKHSFVYVSVVGAPRIDIGKHWIDLTRLLPVTLEELAGEKSSGNWTTNFELIGRAHGAILNVTFSFSASRDSMIIPSSSMSFTQRRNFSENEPSPGEEDDSFNPVNSNATLRRVGSIPSSSNRGPVLSSWSAELNFSQDREVMPSPVSEPLYPKDSLYRKLNEDKGHNRAKSDAIFEHAPVKREVDVVCQSVSNINEDEREHIKFTVTEKQVEMPKEEQHDANQDKDRIIDDSALEMVEANEMYTYDATNDDGETNCGGYVDKTMSECKKNEDDLFNKHSGIGDLECGRHSECSESNSPKAPSKVLAEKNHEETNSSYKANVMVKKSLSLDDLDISKENYLNLMEMDGGAYSSCSDHDPESPRERLLREFEKEALASGNFILDLYRSSELENFGFDMTNGSSSWDTSENTGTPSGTGVAEVHELTSQSNEDTRPENEDVIKQPSLNEKVFQSPPRCYSSDPETPQLPPEWSLQLPPLEDGLAPIVWTKDGGILRLVNPTLFRNAEDGARLSIQASRPIVLPTEMGSGITDILPHMASFGIDKLSAQMERLLPLEDITEKTMQEIAQDAASRVMVPEWVEPEFVLSRDLTSRLTDKIEFLLVEGLRIQCGLSDEDAPSSISLQFPYKTLPFGGRMANFGRCHKLEGLAGLELLVKNNDRDVDGLLDHSITLNEWLRLNAWNINNDAQISEHSNLTIAVRVQLRDPFRNSEPVGIPMLGFMEVEYISNKRVESKNEKLIEADAKDRTSCFRIIGLHLAGLHTETGKKQIWGTVSQLQSGVRWLLASGMGDTSKCPTLEAEEIEKSSELVESTEHPEDRLWSISSDIGCIEASRNDNPSLLDSHVRNPNIIIRKENIRVHAAGYF